VSSDLEVFKAIVDAFERSDWVEIDVSSGSLRIHLSTQPQAAAGDATVAESPDVVPTEAAIIPDGAHVVLSPSPGIFWRSPQPGSPPFADIGDHVEPGTTLGIVEVMKLMNHISSSVGGTVVGVFVENGTRVDRGDALFAVQPSGSP
jgi:acetyl-CoA carboxylase biotin carboxyl carrier protein